MPSSNLFNATTFDTSLLPEQSVVFDANGIIRDGGMINPEQLGYTVAYMDPYIEQGLASFGYGSVVFDVSVQFPNATYYYGLSVGGVDQNGQPWGNADNGIRGTAGSDVVHDILGNNIIDTRGGDDLVIVGGGDDAVKTGGGDDIVFTWTGDDIVNAGSGNDQVFLGDGNDTARGGGGADMITGDGGDDCIEGNGGADTLLGGAGDDELNGGGGHDRIAGGDGTDILTGGRGRDTFVFNLGDDTDTITDLESRDSIELDLALGVTSFNDIAGIASQSGTDLVLSFAGGDQLILEDTILADLAPNDFIFV